MADDGQYDEPIIIRKINYNLIRTVFRDFSPGDKKQENLFIRRMQYRDRKYNTHKALAYLAEQLNLTHDEVNAVYEETT